MGTSSSTATSPPILYTVPAGIVKRLLAGVPARAKSVSAKEAKWEMIEAGGREVKNSPTEPWRWAERRWVLGRWEDSGVVPRALAITFVLPKKRLCDFVSDV